MNVGIIGGGALGLAAAYDLTKEGHTVAVYERAPVLGGQAATFNVGGGRLERGYHHLFRSDRFIIGLIEELGLGDKLAWLESKVGFFSQGRIHPFTTPMDLLRFPPLNLYDRIKLGLLTVYLQKRKYWPRHYENITAAAWIRRYGGKRIYEAVWEPLLRGKFGDKAEDVSMVWLWGKIYLRTTSRGKGMNKELLGYPMGSFGEVFEALEAAIVRQGGAVHYPATVRRIVVEDGRATGLEVQHADGSQETRLFDAILSTTPSFIFPSLVPELPEAYAAPLLKIEYQAAVLIIMVLDRPFSHVYWMNIGDRSIPFVAVVEHTNYVDKKHYGGNHIVYLSNYLGKGSEMYTMDEEELWRLYVPALKKINPSFSETWVKKRYFHREAAAQPIIGRRYSEQIPSLKTPIENLWLANTTQIYPEDRGTNYSVRLGRLVAKMITGQAPVRMWWE